MKSILLLAIAIMSFSVFGQEEKSLSPELPASDSSRIYVYVDVNPEFPGGIKAMRRFLAENIVYPEAVQKQEKGGMCFLAFVISDQGKISQAEIQHGVDGCPECDAEAVRLIGTMPDWKPAQQDGKNVNYRYLLPITFAVNEQASSKSGTKRKKHEQ